MCYGIQFGLSEFWLAREFDGSKMSLTLEISQGCLGMVLLEVSSDTCDNFEMEFDRPSAGFFGATVVDCSKEKLESLGARPTLDTSENDVVAVRGKYKPKKVQSSKSVSKASKLK